MVVVIMMCIVGAYSSRNNFVDLYVFAIGGTLGFFLQKVGIARAPIILGYILSGIIEENLVRALAISRGSFNGIFSRPIAMVFLLIGIISLFNSARKTIIRKK